MPPTYRVVVNGRYNPFCKSVRGIGTITFQAFDLRKWLSNQIKDVDCAFKTDYGDKNVYREAV